jgi:hypothetical protein
MDQTNILQLPQRVPNADDTMSRRADRHLVSPLAQRYASAAPLERLPAVSAVAARWLHALVLRALIALLGIYSRELAAGQFVVENAIDGLNLGNTTATIFLLSLRDSPSTDADEFIDPGVRVSF